jgi:hypothetical protein
MSRSHEQLHPEITHSKEQSERKVESFMRYTKTVLLQENHDLDVEWEYQMNRLFGNEELLQVTKDLSYKGIPGIREYLRSAYENGGLPELKAAFFTKAIEHTNVKNMGDATQTAFKKIIDYK